VGAAWSAAVFVGSGIVLRAAAAHVAAGSLRAAMLQAAPPAPACMGGAAAQPPRAPQRCAARAASREFLGL
jgi:hypothetical protein